MGDVGCDAMYLLLVSCVFVVIQGAEYTHRVVLDNRDQFTLEWRPENQTISFRISVRTLG